MGKKPNGLPYNSVDSDEMAYDDPFTSSGLFYQNSLDQSFFQQQGVCVVFIIIVL